MKKIFLIKTIFFVVSNIYAQTTFNGILDSTVSGTFNDGDFSYGIEEFANLRLQSRLRDNKAVVYGAVNLFAAAGDYALMYGVGDSENYIVGIELERLYFRLNFEKANFDGGLFRLPFGYSQIWGSMDFLNPKNPLKPDARPRGVLGTAVSVFSAGDLKLLSFAVTGRDPFLNDGSGIITGVSAENHWSRASIQGLYSFETSKEETLITPSSKHGIYRAGLSVKADIEAGFIFDALYTYNHEAKTKWDGLSFNIGADYSFVNGNLVILTEYLYNGENSSTAQSQENPLGMPNRDNIYSGITWFFNDFTNITAAVIVNLNDASSTPILAFNHDLFQGAAFTFITQYPIEEKIMICSARLRLRF